MKTWGPIMFIPVLMFALFLVANPLVRAVEMVALPVTVIVGVILCLSLGGLGAVLVWGRYESARGRQLDNQVKRAHLLKVQQQIFPDENGNLPLVWQREAWVNGNLVGADSQPHAWAIWQATNNRSGSAARELFTRPLLPGLPASTTPMPWVSGPGQSEVIDAVAREVQEATE